MSNGMLRLGWWQATLLSAACAVLGSYESTTADEALDRVRAEQERRIEVVAKARAATVAVFDSEGRGGGSGVLLTADGYAITNYHVVKPCGAFMKCGLDDGRIYDAVVVGIDPTGDVALIKLFGRDDFPTAVLADSDTVRMGQPCFAIGNPFLLATNLQPTVTWGLISGIHRYQYPDGTLLEYTDCLQTDASINPGNSGGPLFASDGQVIGINGRISIEKRARVNVGVGYAISANQVRHFFGVLASGRIVDHATLGATMTTSTAGEVTVDAILDGTDAFRRGLRYGDRLLAFGGREVDSVNAFKNVLGIFPKGWRVPMTFEKDGTTIETRVKLAGVHVDEALFEAVQGPAKAEGDAPADPHGPTETKVPEGLGEWYEARRGFANFRFNRLHQDRLLAAYSSSSEAAAATWFVVGKDVSGSPVEIAIGPDTAAWRSGAEVQLIDFEKEIADQRVPEGTNGLLAAAYHWQRLQVGEIKRTGEVIYEGTAPREGLVATHDVLGATLGAGRTEFWYELQTGQLSHLEWAPDDRSDPCVITFSDERELDGRRLPFRWTVSLGDQVLLDLIIDSYRMGSMAGEGGEP